MVMTLFICFGTLLVAAIYHHKKVMSLQKQLHASQTKRQALFDMSLEAIVVYDEHNNIQKANKKALEMFGYNEEDVIGVHFLKFVPDEYKEYAKASVEQKKSMTYETNVLKKDGTHFPVAVSVHYVTINNKLTRISSFIDLTTLRQTESELHELNASLEKRVHEEIQKNREQEALVFQQARMAQMGELLSMIAHQWRQPLASIAATTTNIQTQFDMEKFHLHSEEGQKDCKIFLNKKLQNINTYVQSLSQTIDDFRNFYNPNKKPLSIPINQPIEKAFSILMPSLIAHQIKVIKKLDVDTSLFLHENEMMQVILNLLKNSQDQLLEKQIKNPTIMIRTYKRDNQLYLELSDNAQGIEKEHLAHIFDPYFSTKDQKNGTGLGLYMSKIIIDDHHKGEISVKNAPDGACFTIRLNPDIMSEEMQEEKQLSLMNNYM